MPTGERIAARRRELGWSQVALAERVGRSESWVSQVERGVRHLDRLSVRVALAEVLCMPYAMLFPVIELNELGVAKVELLVDMLLDPAQRADALAALSEDPVVRRVVEELADRLSGGAGGSGCG